MSSISHVNVTPVQPYRPPPLNLVQALPLPPPPQPLGSSGAMTFDINSESRFHPRSRYPETLADHTVLSMCNRSDGLCGSPCSSPTADVPRTSTNTPHANPERFSAQSTPSAPAPASASTTITSRPDDPDVSRSTPPG